MKECISVEDYWQAAENWLYERSDLPQIPPEIIIPVLQELFEGVIEDFIRDPRNYFRPNTETKLIDLINEYIASYEPEYQKQSHLL